MGAGGFVSALIGVWGFFQDFMYLFDTERGAEWQAEAEGETDSPLSREPDGLDSRTLRS